MNGEYDEITAKHYLAYRPPLHDLILCKIVHSGNYFQFGLDIGCGTGQSSIVLAKYCNKVIGIEPSSDMLNLAISNPKVEYLYHKGPTLNLPDHYFDIITFAGSLYYAKSQKLLDEVIRVSKQLALVVAYDFQIILDDVLNQLNIHNLLKNYGYNHEENFSGLIGEGLHELEAVKGTCHILVRPLDLSHFLLSQKDIYIALAEMHKVTDPYQILSEELSERSKESSYKLKANIFYTKYQRFK